MKIDSLKLALAVRHAGGFAAAARDAGIDPSLVSRSIGALESELGFRLFSRNTRRLTVTDAGTAFLDRIAPLLDEMDSALADAASDQQGTPVGRVRLTASVAFGQMWLMPRVPELRDRFPEISLDLVLSDAIIDLVGDPVDLALRLGPLADSSLVGRTLFVVRHRVVATPAYLSRNECPRDPQDLAHHDCVLLPLQGYQSLWKFRRTGTRSETPVAVSGKLVVSSPLALHQAAQAGLGPALLPDWMISSDLNGGGLIDLFPDHDVTATAFDTSATLLYADRSAARPAVRAVADFLTEAARGC
ncbi:MAG: LysR family transcriptional regulator [Pseudomonadota bacterium]